MTLYLLIFSAIIITCVLLNKFSGKMGIPVLLCFLVLGLLCGSRYNEFAAERGWIVGDISTIALQGSLIPRAAKKESFPTEILSWNRVTCWFYWTELAKPEIID